ncbi:glycosyltransferase family 4 protein [Burkholderia cenocepacia]|uniref:glycosyltransferase family 4 protein n=1 Tax=Burkholderia cepacia complex TaxID=87882 RepID=UPI00098F349B|nr:MULTISPECIES: glycosyltransferase family 4 protein [Burkholderia cepacia complex]AQT51981.1 glycosyl transferase family 1 [Burkholderia cenocepacia]MBR8398815.1 glycosyltransferase family 4 protein [Burkholderia cenocepacia]MDN7533401.1 glycosyltransferase family 4 protein [Burkholderia orbicola]
MSDFDFAPTLAERAASHHASNPNGLAAPAAPPLRVALVVEAAGGGVAVHLADLIAGLRARSNAEIHLIAPLGERFDDAMLASAAAQCTSFHRLPLRREVGPHDLRGVLALRRLLRRLQPDIVHSHSSKAGALARLCRGPWKQVYTPHAVYTLNPTLSTAKRAFYGGIERVLGNACSDTVITVSQAEADHLHELGIAQQRIRVVENGVTPPRLLTRQAARIALGLADDTFVVGFVGRFDHQKGVDRLVRIARLLEQRHDRRLQVVAIGSGDFNRAAGDEVRDLPLNLHVAGRVDEARRYFSAFDLLALPSRYEGFPYVCLEAVAAHVPMVATDVAGAAELIAAHRVGLTVPNDDDPAAFAAAVSRLVDHPAAFRQTRDQCARAYPHFSADAMVDRTLAVYRELLKENTQ